jgi:hypothetical protein
MPKISELNEITSLFANDYFSVAHDLLGLPSTKKINVNNLADTLLSYANFANTTANGVVKVGNNLSSNSTGYLSLSKNISVNTISVTSMSGPYSNDYNASVGGVTMGTLYYDSTGVVRIRLV